MARINHCPTCTCGLVGYSYSDRSGMVDPLDPKDVAECLVMYFLDHSYDRMSCLPYDFPEQFESLLAVAHRHLAAKTTNWENETVDMENDERLAFLSDMEASAKEEIDRKAKVPDAH